MLCLESYLRLYAQLSAKKIGEVGEKVVSSSCWTQIELLSCEGLFLMILCFVLKQEEMSEEQKADPFTRRKTLPQLVSMVCVMLIVQLL